MFKIFPPLRIHMWGGLGSQLFAMALAFDLLKKFPKRRIVFIAHTSGVTKRHSDLHKIFPEFQYSEIDDFSSRSVHDSQNKKSSWRSNSLRFMKVCALSTGVLAEENDNVSRLAHRWTLTIRGHYLYRSISDEFLEILGQRLLRFSKLNLKNYEKSAIIHYRLGDLLELDNKESVNVSRIASVVSLLKEKHDVIVLSDSTKIALSLINSENENLNTRAEEMNVFDTILAASCAKAFIGTSSKISYWIILLRLSYTKKDQNFMPQEDCQIVSTLVSTKSKIEYY